MKKKINISIVLFYISYIFILIYYMAGRVKNIEKIRSILFQAIYVILILNIIIQSMKYKYKSIIAIAISIVITFLSYRVSENNSIFLMLLFIIASKNIEFDKFIKFDMIIKVIFMAIILMLYNLDLTRTVIIVRSDGTIRNSLGFGHPNAFGAFVLSVCAEIIYLNYKKTKIIHYIILIIAMIVVSYYCDSRSTQLGIISLILFSIIFPKIEGKRIIEKILPFTFIVLMITSYILVILYMNENPIALVLDDLFTTRIRCGRDFLENYGVHLFGSKLEYYGMWETRSTLTVLDNAYMNILIQFGLSNVILIFGATYFELKKAIKEKRYELVMCLIVFSLYGLMETYLYIIVYNTFILYFSNLIYYKDRKKITDIKDENAFE